MKIILIGLRGSGKSSVGREAAARLDVPFVDLDSVITEGAGRTITRIFEEDGESAFRALEKEALARVLAAPGQAVVATGGGAVMDPDNAAACRAHGLVVWLTADVRTLARRVTADAGSRSTRPSLTGGPVAEELAQVARDRAPLYRAAAHWTLDTEQRSIPQTADAVVAEYRRRREPGTSTS